MKKFALWLFLAVILNTTIYSQWVTVNQLPQFELGAYPSISVPNCSTAVIGGGANNVPKIYITTNSGSNFTVISSNITNNEIYSVYAISRDTIFAGDGGSFGGSGGNAKVYKTVNGGLNWTTILTTGGNSGFISGITFSKSNPDFGIIVSDPAIENDSFWIAKTHNRGKDWVVTKAPNTAPYTTQNSVFAVDSLFYGFGLNSTPCKFYMTTNGGLSWSVKTIGLIGNSIPSIAFQNDKLNGIALSDINLPNIAKTTNGGNNWQTVNAQGLTGTGTIKWIPGTPVYFLAASNIKRSSDNGLTWHQMDAGGVTGFAHMDIYNSGSNSVCAYTIALSGKVLRYEGEPFGIDPANTSIPTEYLLFQNYPNPFNPSTTIKYSVPKPGNVTIKIFDINSKEIMTVVNNYHTAGNYIESIDLSAFSSGVYYYELTAGNIKLFNKMVLLK